jgi:hypothetical protein
MNPFLGLNISERDDNIKTKKNTKGIILGTVLSLCVTWIINCKWSEYKKEWDISTWTYSYCNPVEKWCEEDSSYNPSVIRQIFTQLSKGISINLFNSKIDPNTREGEIVKTFSPNKLNINYKYVIYLREWRIDLENYKKNNPKDAVFSFFVGKTDPRDIIIYTNNILNIWKYIL